MKSVSPQAVAATLLLHAALIAVAAFELASKTEQSTPPAPVAVQILTAQASAEQAPPPQTTAPPAAAPAPKATHPKAKPRTDIKPAPRAPKTKSTPIRTPSSDVDAEATPPSGTPVAPAAPAAPVAPASPSPATASSAAPAAPAAPAKTAASDAGYAAGNPKPTYPRLSKSNNEEGTVVLRVLVKADGTAGAVEIKKSSGYPLLDNSARITVQNKWRFKPATVNGKPVDEWYETSIPFKLTDD